MSILAHTYFLDLYLQNIMLAQFSAALLDLKMTAIYNRSCATCISRKVGEIISQYGLILFFLIKCMHFQNNNAFVMTVIQIIFIVTKLENLVTLINKVN